MEQKFPVIETVFENNWYMQTLRLTSFLEIPEKYMHFHLIYHHKYSICKFNANFSGLMESTLKFLLVTILSVHKMMQCG